MGRKNYTKYVRLLINKLCVYDIALNIVEVVYIGECTWSKELIQFTLYFKQHVDFRLHHHRKHFGWVHCWNLCMYVLLI